MSRVEIVDRNANPRGTPGKRWLLKDVETGDFYVASGVNAMYTGWEVLVFPADERGEITSYGDVAGGRGITYEDAVESLEQALNSEEMEVR